MEDSQDTEDKEECTDSKVSPDLAIYLTNAYFRRLWPTRNVWTTRHVRSAGGNVWSTGRHVRPARLESPISCNYLVCSRIRSAGTLWTTGPWDENPLRRSESRTRIQRSWKKIGTKTTQDTAMTYRVQKSQ